VSRLPRSLVNILLAIAFMFSARLTAGAQKHPSAPHCFRLEFARDTLVSWYPDRLQWSPDQPIAHVAWDTTSRDSRELRRQTRGQAKWRRIGNSVDIDVWHTFVSSMIVHFVVRSDSIAGTMSWYGEAGPPEATRPFIGLRIPCPVRDHAS
jgi:hypothetical protein